MLAYDVEVFETQSCVVFKNLEGETVRIFANSLTGLGEYLDSGIIQGLGFEGLKEFISDKTLIGYNNFNYDDYILYAMSIELSQETIKEWNDRIINNDTLVNMKKVSIETIDCYQQISISKPGLKKIEGNLGKSIIETEVDFTTTRKLTADEWLSVVKYCEYDVLQTINVYKMRNDYFSSKEKVVEMLPEEIQEKASKWNTTSIIAQLLKPKNKVRSGLLVSDEYLNYVPLEVKDMWLELNKTIDYKFTQKKVIVKEFGNDIEFGWGGLHGAPQGVYEVRNVKLLDVASMYPNILINFNGLGDKTQMYKDILEYRLQLKHEGKKEEQAPYKLILNSTYGLLNNQYSAINKPSLAYSICVYGQISLYTLAGMLDAAGCKVFNINTDGVAFEAPDESYMQVWKNWEKIFNLNLELDEFDYWIQKDVNNYIAVDKKGNIKVKGGDVNKYHKDNYFNNNDIRIVDVALVDYIVYGNDISETIVKNLDKPRLYQYVLQAGRTYKGTVDENGSVYQKVNRVFAVKDNEKSVTLFKQRLDDGLVKFADTPDNMMIWNDDLEKLDKDYFKKIIDLQWYYDLTMKRLERWKV